MASMVYFLVFLGFIVAFTQSVTSEHSNEWDFERSSENPLSYTDEGHYSQNGATQSSPLISQKRKKCPANEHYTPFDANCEITCSNYKKPLPCERLRIWGCVCDTGLVRGPDKTCIKPTECPPEQQAEAQRICPLNEHFALFDPNCEITCSNYKKPLPCERLRIPGCVCDTGLVRGPDKKCIKPTECPPEQQAEAQQNFLPDAKDTQSEERDHSPNSENPPASKPKNWPPLPFPIPLICGKNEVFVPIPTSCPVDCNNFRNKERKCAKVLIPSCFCKDGFVRNHEGKCIKPYECPQEKNFCPRGEEYSSCHSHCEENCYKKGDKEECKKSPLCVPGCTCKEGLVRGPDGTCIYNTECPSDPPTEPPKKVCPENELYDECRAACQRNCSNIDTGIPCPRICIPGCVCKESLIRGKYGKCVEEDECPKEDFPHESSHKCPRNHRFLPCDGHCQRNCTNKDDKDFICRPVCIPGCVCEEGFVKGPDGDCIETEKCPESDSERVQDFVTLNPPPYTDDDYVIPESKAKITPIWETEDSQFEEIPPRHHSNQFPFPFITCGKNEVREISPSNCPDDCNNYLDQNRKCGKSLLPACVCKKGFVRGPEKICIEPTKCPQDKKNCGKGEIWRKCHGNCEKNCDNWAQDIICPKACVSGCVCRPGLIRGKDKKCDYWFKCPRKPSSYPDIE